MNKKHIGPSVMAGLLGAALLLCCQLTVMAQQLAFSGAEGFGRHATGGRGGEVYHVTNLNDSGAGSFRDAVSQSNRIVVFDVGGVINISSRIVIKKNITIAGQTAPGGGITIYGNGIALNGDSGNDIIRYIRIRMGVVGDSGKDAVGISAGQDYMFDHVSVSWGRDGTVDINGSGIDNISLQSCIIGQGLHSHSTGGLMQSGKTSVIRSLYIDNHTRNPKGRGVQEYINNVIYNWRVAGYILGDTEGLSEANIMGNYFIKGPSTSSAPFNRASASFHVHAWQNWYDANRNGLLDGEQIPETSTGYGPVSFEAAPYDYPGVAELLDPETAYYRALTDAGASKVRDDVDVYLIRELSSLGKAGAIISKETENPIENIVGYLASGRAPLDTDQDGMPDLWETANGFDPNLQDHNGDADNDGFSNIEEYLEWAVDNSVEGLGPADNDLQVQEYELGFCGFEGAIDADNAGFTGAGFVNTDNAIGAGINWKVNATGGSCILVFRYANGGNTDRAGQLLLNGSKLAVVPLYPTGDWAVWAITSAIITLPAGECDLRLEATTEAGLANIDYMELQGANVSLANCGGQVAGPTVLIDQGSGTMDQAINTNTALTNIVYRWENATSVMVSGLPTGLSVNISPVDQTVSIQGTPTVGGTFNYAIQTFGGTGDTSIVGTLTVTETPTAIGADKATTRQLAILPNPTTGIFYIDKPQDLDATTLWLFNAQGSVAATFSLASGGGMDIGQLPCGVYQAVFYGKGIIYRQSIVKQ